MSGRFRMRGWRGVDVLLLLPVVIYCAHCADSSAPPVGGVPDTMNEEPVLLSFVDQQGNTITQAGPGDVIGAMGTSLKGNENRVFFGNKEAVVLGVSDDGTRIDTIVPEMSEAGSVSVYVTVDGVASNSLDLYISLIPGGNFVNALGPVDASVDSPRDRLFIANTLSNSVSVLGIGPDGNEYLHNVSVGKVPTAVIVDPKTGLAYVADSGSGQVSMIEPDANFRVTCFATGTVDAAPTHLAINPVSRELYVAGARPKAVGVFDLDAQIWKRFLILDGPPGGSLCRFGSSADPRSLFSKPVALDLFFV